MIMDDLTSNEEEDALNEMTEEELLAKNDEDNLKNFRELLMQENISILAKLKIYKSIDFRRKLVLDQSKELKRLSELSKIWVSVPFVEQTFNRSVITVDSSKAGSNIDVLRLAINDLDWKEYPYGRTNKTCHVIWNSCSFNDNRSHVGAFVNKFPGMIQCLHKVGFSRILETMRTLFPDHFSFYPLTWYLPHQMNDFTMYCQQREVENKSEMYYIVKPDAGTQGEGIYLIRKPQEYKMSSKNHVVQEYLVSPLLLDGYKFDLRIYVVLISLDPLKVYICNEGLARFCTQQYCHPTVTNHGNSFMHLTNYSLNKKSNEFIHTQELDTGSKRTMSSVFAALECNGCNVACIWKKLEELVYKTILAIVPQLKVRYVTEVLAKTDDINMKSATIPVEDRPNCFQILGFDVLIMEDLEPLLLEVNSNPSLRLDCEMEIAPGICEYYLSRVDMSIKIPLVKDTLRLLKEEISKKFNINTKIQENCDLAKIPNDISPVTNEISAEQTMLDSSDKENMCDNDNEWSLDSEFGPYFVEIAKRNNTLPKGFQLKSSNSLNDLIESGDTLVSNSHVSRQDTKVGISPYIRGDHERRAMEKSWLNGSEMKDNERTEGLGKMTSGICFTRSDESAEESCLSLITSASYRSIYDKLSILEETTVIFFHAMGHRYTENMGATAFRTFGRHCKLHLLGFNCAMIDLIYIEVQRRWSYLTNYETTQGLCYQAFLEAFFRIAFARFVNQSKRGAVHSLIDHCKRSIGLENFGWANTLYPRTEKKFRLRSDFQKVLKPFTITKERHLSLSNRPLSVRSSSSKTSDSNNLTKSVLRKQSKYELMKAVQQIYRRKVRIPRSSKLADGYCSDSDSVNASSSNTNSTSEIKKQSNTGKQLLYSRVSSKITSNITPIHKDNNFKIYRYESPVAQSTNRNDFLRGSNLTNLRQSKTSNSMGLNSIPNIKTDLNLDKDFMKKISGRKSSYSIEGTKRNDVSESRISLNIRNNMKQLSPVNNDRMMEIISIYGGRDMLKTSLNRIQQKYGMLKPI